MSNLDHEWKAGDDDGGFGNTMSIVHFRDQFMVEIDEPWAGDTKTGFGQTCRHTLSRADAERLRDWLTAILLEKGDG